MRVAVAHDDLARRSGAERLDPEGRLEPLAGVEPGYWLVVSRGGECKHIGATIDGVAKCQGGRLLVIGHPPRPLMAHDPRVHYTGAVSDAELRWAYVNARGLIAMTLEDSGRTPIEANGFGTPVLALRPRGLSETVVEGVTGVYVDRPVSFEIARALRDFPALDADAIRRHAAVQRRSAAEPANVPVQQHIREPNRRSWKGFAASRYGGST